MHIPLPATLTAAVFAAAALFSPVLTANAVAGTTHTVEIRKLEFAPLTLSVQLGDIVIWVNQDLVPHTVTADDKSWDSPTLEAGEEWRMEVRGEMHEAYFCRFHPTMKARLQIRSR